jgi:pilus assembly protein CpaB
MVGIAAVFGAIAILAADIWIKSAADARVQEIALPVADPAVEFKTIVVAAQPLGFGAELDRSQLVEIPWPQDALPVGAFATVDSLLAEGSRAVLSPIEPNEPVLLAKLSGPDGRATLSNMMLPGMRAVTIKIDEVAGVGGFVTPGDRVDIVLTRDAGAIDEVSSNASGAAGSTLVSEVALENVKVLSVGQGADMRQTNPQISTSVTVEVTAAGANKIALARSIGALSLSLRAARQEGGSAGGVTTIKNFNGSVSAATADAAGTLVKSLTESDGPKHKTVIVTRGIEPQTYQVVAPEN